MKIFLSIKSKVVKVHNFLSWQISRPIQLEGQATLHLDLGAGAIPRNPFGASKVIATDIVRFPGDDNFGTKFVQADLTKSLPFQNAVFDSVSAFDVLEHVPRWERDADGSITYPFINLMSEVSRILKPNGYFMAYTPAFPKSASFQDPTHVNFLTKDTVYYFCGDNPEARSLGYGFTGSFALMHQSWVRGVGPFSHRVLAPNLISRSGIQDSLRCAYRILRLARKRKPSHLLWILRNQT